LAISYEVSNTSLYVTILVILHNKYNFGRILGHSDLYFYNKKISAFYITSITTSS